MNILWFLDKEFDVALNVSARLATIIYLEKRNNIILITNFRKEKIYSYDIDSKVVYLDRINFPFIKTLSFYYQQIKFLDKGIDLKNIDVVLVNSNNIFLLKKLLEKRKNNNLKLVVDIRSLAVESNCLKRKMNDFFFKKSLKIAAKYFDGISYITDEMRRYCENKYNLPEHKAAVWSSGVDMEMFKPLNLSRASKKFRFMYHGVITKSRGIINVLKSLDKLREYDIEFFLLGCGKEISELKSLVRKLQLENKVNFHSFVPHKEISRYINIVDAGILPFPEWPGWNTSSPIKLFEYLACGKPVIVTRIPAHIGVLEGRNFAFWAETSNPESIAKAILEAYKNRKNFKKIGKEARDFIEKNYTWEKQVSKLEKFFENIQC